MYLDVTPKSGTNDRSSATRADLSGTTKRLAVGSGYYIEVPIACRPGVIAQNDWDRLSRINNYIIDHVSYDHSRSRAVVTGGVQSPDITLKRGLGVCMDYSALFESLARQAGFSVRSMHSESMNHAWNMVLLANQWWIVDVTWNGSDMFSSGKRIPANVKDDPDFRKEYFLVKPESELALFKQGVLSNTHAVSDAQPVDYEKTLEATAIVDQLSPLLDQRHSVVQRQKKIVARHNDLVDAYNNIVDVFNRQRTAQDQVPYKSQLDKLKVEKAESGTAVRKVKAEIDSLDTKIDALYSQFRRLDAAYPLAISYSISKT